MSLFRKKPSVNMKIESFDGIICNERISEDVKSAVYMRNWRITDDGKLQKRCGCECVLRIADTEPIYCGRVGTGRYYVYKRLGGIWTYCLDDESMSVYATSDTSRFTAFLFGSLLYIMGRDTLLTFDGHITRKCEPYIPKLAVSAPNTGGGVILEDLNRISPYARISYSPDGVSPDFVLPKEALAVVRVTDCGVAVDEDKYTYDRGTHTLTMSYVPSADVPDGLEVTFVIDDDDFPDSSLLYGKSYCLFGSGNDSRVFVYGGDNTIYYSDVTDRGADCTYFPVNNFIRVGDGGEVTALVRHYSTLAVFTENDAWYISPSSIEDGDYSKLSFPVFPLNGKVGCVREGAVLVNNSPLSVRGDGVYIWASSNIRDERNARLISAPVAPLLSREFLASSRVLDHEGEGEVWIWSGDLICVYNYRRTAWYFYDGIRAERAYELDGVVYFVNDTGLYRFDKNVYTDDGRAYSAIWESAYADFGISWRKNIARMFVSLIPETHSDVRITVSPNKSGGCRLGEDGCYGSEVFDFSALDFSKLSFECEGRPSLVRSRLNIRGVDSIKLRIENSFADSRCTVNGILLAGCAVK